MLNVFYMLLTVVVPLSLVVFGVVLSFGQGNDIKSKASSAITLDTEHGLIKQGLLWLAIGCPLSLGVAFGIWAWSGYGLSLNAEGYKKFIEISILPLALMSISLPLAGLVSRFHSTQQAAKQISITMFKNNVDAYFSHRKGMLEYFSSLGEMSYFDVCKFEYKAHLVLHKRFFKGSPEKGWPSMNEVSFGYIEENIRSAAELLVTVLDGSSSNRLNDYLQASLKIYLAAQMLHIKEIIRDMAFKGVYVRWLNSEGGVLTQGVTTLETLASIRFVREYYNNFCDFSGRDRMKLSKDLEGVFLKTDCWLKKGKYIESIHAEEVVSLVESGQAEYGEKHADNIGGREF